MHDILELLRLLIELTAAVGAVLATWIAKQNKRAAKQIHKELKETPSKVVDEIEKKNGSYIRPSKMPGE